MLGGRPRHGPPCCADTACPGFRVIGFRFLGSRIVVPYAPPPFGIGVSGVSQVCLRLPRLSVHIRICTDYAPSLRPPYCCGHHHYYGLLPHGLAGHFLPARRRCHFTYFNFLKCRPWFLCSLCFSFPYRF